ncbi:MAG: sodium/proline symporter [Clostridia bacterium]|nr:sodium/proline symporter [Clostridiales bacterium]
MITIIVVMLTYMALMLYIGYRASRKVKTSEDFLIGGRTFGINLTAIAHQAAGLSGWLFIAWVGQVASTGFGAIWTAFSSGFAPFINFFVLAKRVSKFTLMTKARSFIDLLEARYYDGDKKHIRAISAVIIFISITVYLSSQLMAAGTTLQAVLGWDYTASVVLGAIVVIAYTSAGGLLAVAWTDFVQGMLMIFAVLAGLFVAFSHTGGLGAVFEGMKAINPKLMNPWIAPITIVGLLSAGWLGYMGQPQLVQMFMGMKNPDESRKGAMIAGTTGVFLLFSTFFMYMACLVMFPQSADPNTNFIQMIMTYTPSFLAGIVTAAILAAVMSSSDALLHVANTAVCQDFYNKMLKGGNATDKEVLMVGRISAIIIGAAAIYIALNPFEGVLWVNWWAWGGLSSFAPVVVLGLYWKRATREGAIAGLIGGFLGSAIWFAVGYYKWLHLTFVAFVCAMVLLVAVSLVTPAPPKEIQDQVNELGNGMKTAAR